MNVAKGGRPGPLDSLARNSERETRAPPPLPHVLLPRSSQRSPRRPHEAARATEPGSRARWERTGQEAQEGHGSRGEALGWVRAVMEQERRPPGCRGRAAWPRTHLHPPALWPPALWNSEAWRTPQGGQPSPLLGSGALRSQAAAARGPARPLPSPGHRPQQGRPRGASRGDSVSWIRQARRELSQALRAQLPRDWPRLHCQRTASQETPGDSPVQGHFRLCGCGRITSPPRASVSRLGTGVMADAPCSRGRPCRVRDPQQDSSPCVPPRTRAWLVRGGRGSRRVARAGRPSQPSTEEPGPYTLSLSFLICNRG